MELKYPNNKEKASSSETYAFLITIAIFLPISFWGLFEIYALVYTYVLMAIVFLVLLLSDYTQTPKLSNTTQHKLKDFPVQSLLTLFIIGSLISPYFIGQSCYSCGVAQGNVLDSDTEKVIFSSQFSFNHTYWGMDVFGKALFRFKEDFSSYTILGLGACAELAYIEKTILEGFNIQSRQIIFAEDHELLEVNINGTWLASDPGFGLWLISTWERGEIRLAEYGGVSLLYVKYSNPLVFVTENYVPTDTINLQVLKNGSAYSGGAITLTHEFQGKPITISPIILDVDGKVTLKIGSMQYFPKANAEDYYRISIDGQEVANVTSYGNNTIWPLLTINI